MPRPRAVAGLLAVALWLLYLDGKRDWQVHHVPTVSD